MVLQASLSGRVRDGGAKELLKKQLAGITDNMPELMDLKTGKLGNKKGKKKEKSPEEEVLQEVKKLSKKFLGI